MDIERCEFQVDVSLPRREDKDDVELFLTPRNKFLDSLFPIRPAYGASSTLERFQHTIDIEQENICRHGKVQRPVKTGDLFSLKARIAS